MNKSIDESIQNKLKLINEQYELASINSPTKEKHLKFLEAELKFLIVNFEYMHINKDAEGDHDGR